MTVRRRRLDVTMLVVGLVLLGLVALFAYLTRADITRLTRLLPRITFLQEARPQDIGLARGPAVLTGWVSALSSADRERPGRVVATWLWHECNGIEKSASVQGEPFRLRDDSGSVLVDPGNAEAWFESARSGPAKDDCSHRHRQVVEGRRLLVVGCVVGGGAQRRVTDCDGRGLVLTDDVGGATAEARSQATESLRSLALFVPLGAFLAGLLITRGPRRASGGKR